MVAWSGGRRPKPESYSHFLQFLSRVVLVLCVGSVGRKQPLGLDVSGEIEWNLCVVAVGERSLSVPPERLLLRLCIVSSLQSS